MPYTNAEPLKFLFEYDAYLDQVCYHLTGYKKKEVPKGEPQTLQDGTVIQNYEIVEVKDPNVNAICNREGGSYVVNQFRKYLNKYCAMGDLNRDDIAEICGDAIKVTYDPLIAYGRTLYGVTNLSLLKADGLANFDSLYIYFTALKDGELKKQVLATTQAQYTMVQQAAPQEQRHSILGIGGHNQQRQ